MIKVQELKDDAIVDIKINKTYYLMVKAVSFKLVKEMFDTNPDPEYLKESMTKKYEDMDDLQRSFHTIALLLSEIETQSRAQEKVEDKEILEPGDEGYEAPTEG
jgi:hypothetical protein